MAKLIFGERIGKGAPLKVGCSAQIFDASGERVLLTRRGDNGRWCLQGDAVDLSLRSVQRRFLRATGLTHGTVSQIERAHHAVALLRRGVSILDTVERTGYADQPHLTRSLKRLIGQTPAQLISENNATQLSYSSVIHPAE